MELYVLMEPAQEYIGGVRLHRNRSSEIKVVFNLSAVLAGNIDRRPQESLAFLNVPAKLSYRKNFG